LENLIEKKFEEMGARVNIGELPNSRFVNDPNRRNSTVLVNVIDDDKGQVFDIQTRGKVDLTITDIRPDDRHLVLLAKIFGENQHIEPDKIKFLCGHDEREWFSCQLNDTSVTTVDTAKLSLRPDAVRKSHRKNKVKHKDRVKRKNEGSLRQGEWFFVPVDVEDPEMDIILRNEPLMVSNIRGGSKPHIAQFAFRTGGENVYVPQLPFSMAMDDNIDRERLSAGLTEREKKQYIKRNPESKKWRWTHQVRNPELYVKGTIRHPDHATLKLRQWHQVHMNREIRGRFNVFLD
jgi:hypothetical protein